MKRFTVMLAAIAALGLVTGTASACDGEKKATAQKVSATEKAGASCASKASTAKTVSAGASCSSAKAMTASAGASCSSAKAMTASAGMSCSSAKAMTASAGHCKSTHVVYLVGETETFDAAEARAMAEKSGEAVKFVAAGASYEDESAAKMAMTKAMHARLGEMLTVSTSVGGESYSCATSAAKTAEKSGKPVRFVVANHEFESKEAAQAYLVKAKAAVDAVALVDASGEAVNGCAMSYAKDKGATAFKLGDQEIHCPVTANYTAAQAKIAALMAMDA